MNLMMDPAYGTGVPAGAYFPRFPSGLPAGVVVGRVAYVSRFPSPVGPAPWRPSMPVTTPPVAVTVRSVTSLPVFPPATTQSPGTTAPVHPAMPAPSPASAVAAPPGLLAELQRWLESATIFASLPNWLLAGAGVVGIVLLSGGRRK